MSSGLNRLVNKKKIFSASIELSALVPFFDEDKDPSLSCSIRLFATSGLNRKLGLLLSLSERKVWLLVKYSSIPASVRIFSRDMKEHFTSTNK